MRRPGADWLLYNGPAIKHHEIFCRSMPTSAITGETIPGKVPDVHLHAMYNTDMPTPAPHTHMSLSADPLICSFIEMCSFEY